MNTSWSIRLKESRYRCCNRILVGQDGGVPVIVQGYDSILRSPADVSRRGKKVVTRRKFVLLRM